MVINSFAAVDISEICLQECYHHFFYFCYLRCVITPLTEWCDKLRFCIYLVIKLYVNHCNSGSTRLVRYFALTTSILLTRAHSKRRVILVASIFNPHVAAVVWQFLAGGVDVIRYHRRLDLATAIMPACSSIVYMMSLQPVFPYKL